MIKHIIGVLVGCSLLGGIFLLQGLQNKNTNSIRPTIIGKVLRVEFLNKPAGEARGNRIYAILSPNCPHCKNVLKFLNAKDVTLAYDVDFYPVFKESVSEEAIGKLLLEVKVTLPVFRIKSNPIVRELRYVPTFIYVEKDVIKNVIVGGAVSSDQFDVLLKTLIRS